MPRPPHMTSSSTTLHAKIGKALAEQRTKQALELAKELQKREPSPAHHELLHKAYLARGRDLAAHGHTRDASDVFQQSLRLTPPAQLMAEVVSELAKLGDVRTLSDVLPKMQDPAQRVKIEAGLIDVALAQGSAGRALLPAPLHPQFDAVLQAFAAAARGDDEAARTQLQAIGLQSPFLEWKLLLRGLLAYYQGDDARALENWQRLSSERQPLRLAAPFRAQLDKQFAAAQPPAIQLRLRQQLEQLQGATLGSALRTVQQALNTKKEHLGDAFRQVEPLAAQLRRDAPDQAARLAWCFYWAIIHQGHPEDMKRFQRVFGRLTDDPNLERLEALALEERGELGEAHKRWVAYEKTIAGDAAHWPGAIGQRARALILSRMGNNALEALQEDEVEDDPFFGFTLGGPRRRQQPLKPSAEECYQRSLQLAPSSLSVHEALVNYYQSQQQPEKAEAAARQLLQHFPEHGPTLEHLGDLRLQRDDFAEALASYQRALQINPLARHLRGKVANTHASLGKHYAGLKKIEQARAELQAALALAEKAQQVTIRCQWAATEFKAGDATRAEELLQQATAASSHPIAVTFIMLGEVSQLKLTKLKSRFMTQWKDLRAAPPTGAAAAALADTAALHLRTGVSYVGQQTRTKEVLDYLHKAEKAAFTAGELLTLITALETLPPKRGQRTAFLVLATRQFPENPHFILAELRALLQDRRVGSYHLWSAKPRLDKAKALVEAMPRSIEQQDLLQEIGKLEAELGSNIGFGGFMGMPLPFDIFGGGPDEDEFDDEFGDDEF